MDLMKVEADIKIHRVATTVRHFFVTGILHSRDHIWLMKFGLKNCSDDPFLLQNILQAVQLIVFSPRTKYALGSVVRGCTTGVLRATTHIVGDAFGP